MIPTSYQRANESLTGRCKERRKVANNTYLERRNGAIALRLHSTDVVTYNPDNSLTLNSGGWYTVTTKDRINQALPRGLSLFQDKGRWYIQRSWSRGLTPYTDGIIIHGGADDPITGAGSRDDIADNALKRKVSKFAKLCADSLPLPKPSGGDCWYCFMRAEDGTTLGDKVSETDHLDSHIEEGYVVPLLVYQALEEKRCGQAFFGGAFGEDEKGFYIDIARREVKRAVYRYIMRRKGFAIN